MGEAEVMDIGKEAIFVLMKISLPIMLIALVVGLIISLFQALTQIQEATLSFVPKIIAVFVSILIFMPFIVDTLKVFAESLSAKIIGLQ